MLRKMSLEFIMERHDLQNALNELSARPVPELPLNFEQNVWREIRSRSCVQKPAWDALITNFLRPSWALSAAAVVLLISISFGAKGIGQAHGIAHDSLNLDVFSADAPALPSTLLARAQ